VCLSASRHWLSPQHFLTFKSQQAAATSRLKHKTTNESWNRAATLIGAHTHTHTHDCKIIERQVAAAAAALLSSLISFFFFFFFSRYCDWDHDLRHTMTAEFFQILWENGGEEKIVLWSPFLGRMALKSPGFWSWIVKAYLIIPKKSTKNTLSRLQSDLYSSTIFFIAYLEDFPPKHTLNCSQILLLLRSSINWVFKFDSF
jgi:hypothetical protein